MMIDLWGLKNYTIEEEKKPSEWSGIDYLAGMFGN